MATSDIGLIGLAVMGQNLVLNIDERGYAVSVYNRTYSVTEAFLAGPAKGTRVRGFKELADFVASLKRPRRVMLMVKAEAVDAVIDSLLPHLEPGDVIIDGGNSNYQDSTRRTRALKARGVHFIGAGISGGEAGARHGPSIMPGGDPEGWPLVKELLQAIAAKVDGVPCCDWVGEEGAGHYVKMVHNGIEYGDMQLIAEAYHLMQLLGGLDNGAIGEVFARWNAGKLNSYLIEITADIFKAKDETGGYVLDVILDSAGQKGTGKWTVASALEQGVPLTLIGEAVFARFLSALKAERVRASGLLSGPAAAGASLALDDLKEALYAAKIISYAQGYMLFRAASARYGWQLNYAGIAQLWRGGCIIRSRFLSDIVQAYREEPELENLLLAPFFREALAAAQMSWRRVVAAAVTCGVPVPALSAALSFYDGYRLERLPANLIQAQRDYFGAHTYERLDRPRGEFFHTDWQSSRD